MVPAPEVPGVVVVLAPSAELGAGMLLLEPPEEGVPDEEGIPDEEGLLGLVVEAPLVPLVP
ncbi:hypothetical protein [Noviherbaspirillum saxi]|uniref:hypothetical protein n=1 Tax=Noviherbaspirillum saxi TaxID=2320863 RepID=UPI0011C35194|nr:hypothetical protein [Noviherbaspirillum saxi]